MHIHAMIYFFEVKTLLHRGRQVHLWSIFEWKLAFRVLETKFGCVRLSRAATFSDFCHRLILQLWHHWTCAYISKSKTNYFVKIWQLVMHNCKNGFEYLRLIFCHTQGFVAWESSCQICFWRHEVNHFISFTISFILQNMTVNQEFQQEKHSVFQSYSGIFGIIGRTNIISVIMAIVPCFETLSWETVYKPDS